jgi:hypothetical protein
MRKWLSRGWRIGAVLFAVWLIYAICASWYWQIRIGERMERELEFRIGTPVIQEDGTTWPREVVSIESLRRDGVLGQAGLREGDIICGLSVGDVFKMLHRGRGGQVTLQVVNGGDGPPISLRQVRPITFKVPAGS